MKRKLKTLQELFNMLKSGNKVIEFPTDLKYGEFVDAKMGVHDSLIVGNACQVMVPESWFEPLIELPENCGILYIKGWSGNADLPTELVHEIKFSPAFTKYVMSVGHNAWTYRLRLERIER